MTMMLNSDDIARITGGKWLNLKGSMKFHGVRVNINLTEENDLYFTTTPAQWGDKIPKTMRTPFRDQGEKEFEALKESFKKANPDWSDEQVETAARGR